MNNAPGLVPPADIIGVKPDRRGTGSCRAKVTRGLDLWQGAAQNGRRGFGKVAEVAWSGFAMEP